MKKKMLIIGLTGSIGMGKSTAANLLKDRGFPVYDADKAVHGLLAKGGKAIVPVAKIFPTCIKRGAVDLKILGQLVFGKPALLKKLENILHPLVRKEEDMFLRAAKRAKASAAILEIPLLFETGADRRCDLTVCVTASRAIQKSRVLQRPGMTEEKFKAIIKHQMPDAEKRACADYIVQTGKGFDATKRQLAKIIHAHHLD